MQTSSRAVEKLGNKQLASTHYGGYNVQLNCILMIQIVMKIDYELAKNKSRGLCRPQTWSFLNFALATIHQIR
jgi:hypothetical protein